MADKVNILLVEDNEGDILLTREAFDANASSCQLKVVRNWGDAIDFIFGRGCYARAQRPGLIFLTLTCRGRKDWTYFIR